MRQKRFPRIVDRVAFASIFILLLALGMGWLLRSSRHPDADEALVAVGQRDTGSKRPLPSIEQQFPMTCGDGRGALGHPFRSEESPPFREPAGDHDGVRFSPTAASLDVRRLTSEPLPMAELRAPVIRSEEELAGLDPIDRGRAGGVGLEAAFRTVRPKLHAMSEIAPEGMSPRSVDPGLRISGDPPTVERIPRSDGESFLLAPGAGRLSHHQSRSGLSNSWPATPALIRDLKQVAILTRIGADEKFASARSSELPVVTTAAMTVDRHRMAFAVWQTAVEDRLGNLQALPSIASPESDGLLAELSSLASAGVAEAEAIRDRDTQLAAIRAALALSRRIDVWCAIHRCLGGESSSEDASDYSASHQVKLAVEEVRADLAGMRQISEWAAFLLLAEWADAVDSGDESARRLVAQRFLSRLEWRGLTVQQCVWLDRESVRSLAAVAKPWAVGPVDYVRLMHDIEGHETDPILTGGYDIANSVQSLRFASSANARMLARTIDRHYRNANVRLAINSDWIERMIPEVDPQVRPVRDHILGSDVRGESRIRTKLGVRLLPSENSWRFELRSRGEIASKTASRQGPVSIRSTSDAGFESVTPIEFGPDFFDVAATRLTVDSQTEFKGVRTDYDSVPLLGYLVRELAKSRYRSVAPTAKQIQDDKIGVGVGGEVDRKVRDQVGVASSKVSDHFVAPLGSLGLNPQVYQMQTTVERLIARCRLGGDWQMGSFTPRPRAPSDSLLSVQLHQSALNNLLDRVIPGDRSLTVEALMSELRERFRVAAPVAVDGIEPDGLGSDVTILFASTRPVAIEIVDDRISVTLRIQRLHRPDSIDLRNFAVRVGYRGQVEGAALRLLRDGPISVSGPRVSMRERLPVRAIFNKVFSDDRPIDLIPPAVAERPALRGLQVAQFELRDGWLAFALTEGSGASQQQLKVVTRPEPAAVSGAVTRQ
jgi:hypothetical protein